MPKYTKYLEFSQKERTAIRERDNYRCIFCRAGYKMPSAAVPEMNITDIMHYIPRSSMDLASDRTEQSDAGTTIICWTNSVLSERTYSNITLECAGEQYGLYKNLCHQR